LLVGVGCWLIDLGPGSGTPVALAGELECTSVFTTDRTGVSVYRIKGRKAFHILPSD
jgi:hypothetical protein